MIGENIIETEAYEALLRQALRAERVLAIRSTWLSSAAVMAATPRSITADRAYMDA